MPKSARSSRPFCRLQHLLTTSNLAHLCTSGPTERNDQEVRTVTVKNMRGPCLPLIDRQLC